MKIKFLLFAIALFLAPSLAQTPPPTGSYIFNKTICLDGIIPDREVLPDKSLGPERLSLPGGCVKFAVQLPLASEDAQLLEGRLPKDDALLNAMDTQWGNAQTASIASEMSSDAQGRATYDKLMGAIWQAFGQNRESFCSRHPRMLVLKLNLDGTTTIPTQCDKQ